MSNTRLSWFKWSIVSVALAAVGALCISARAQEAATPAAPSTGYVDDWTHHHVVFSNPGTREEAVRNGTLDRWTRITNDPRYKMQQVKRNLGTRTVVADPDFGFGPGGFRNDRGPRRSRPKNLPVQGGLEKDWNTPLGGAPSVSATGLTGTVNTLVAGSIGPNSTLSIQLKFGTRTFNFRILQASAPTPQTEALTFNGAPANGSSVTVGGITYTFSTSNITTAPASGCTVYSAAGNTGATNLRDAIDNTNPGATTFMCAAASTPNPLVTATSRNRFSSTVNVYAVTNGPVTTFTFSQSGTTNINATATAGTDGGSYCTPPTGPYYSSGGGFFNTPRFCYWGQDGANTYDSSSEVATNIANAINHSWLGQFINATVSGSTITYTLQNGANNIAVVGNNFTAYSSGSSGGIPASVQPNALPAMYSSSPTTGSCSLDFVVYPTGQPGSSTAANIIAYNQLYGVTADATATPPVTGTGCGATSGVNVPTAYWAYNTGANEMVSTSPILSYDGTQVAFVESTGSTANLVLLKWKATAGSASIQSPDTINTASSAANYRTGCTLPCMFTLPLSHDSSYSAPYYDYTTDTIYVGDNLGSLYKFTGVFLGTPGGGSFATTAGFALSSPVYDATSGNTYVGDMAGTFWSVSSGGAHNNIGAFTDAMPDGPLVDSSAGMVYVFLGDCLAACGQTEPGWDAVAQISIASNSVVGAVQLGTGGKGYYIYDGAFDNAYFTSANPASPSGNLYVLGNTGPTQGGGTLYQVPITNNGLGTPNEASGLSSSGVSPWPSPVTEYYNTSSGTDYIYFSVNSGTASASCTEGAGNGCILEFDVSNGQVSSTIGGQNFTNVGGKGCWATGGISIDGSTAGVTGTQNIYFVSMNGAVAGSNGGLSSIRGTSSQCGTSTPAILGAIQASQNNP